MQKYKNIIRILIMMIIINILFCMPVYAEDVIEQANITGVLNTVFTFARNIGVPLAIIGLVLCAFRVFTGGEEGWKKAKTTIYTLLVSVAVLSTLPLLVQTGSVIVNNTGWDANIYDYTANAYINNPIIKPATIKNTELGSSGTSDSSEDDDSVRTYVSEEDGKTYTAVYDENENLISVYPEGCPPTVVEDFIKYSVTYDDAGNIISKEAICYVTSSGVEYELDEYFTFYDSEGNAVDFLPRDKEDRKEILDFLGENYAFTSSATGETLKFITIDEVEYIEIHDSDGNLISVKTVDSYL